MWRALYEVRLMRETDLLRTRRPSGNWSKGTNNSNLNETGVAPLHYYDLQAEKSQRQFCKCNHHNFFDKH